MSTQASEPKPTSSKIRQDPPPPSATTKPGIREIIPKRGYLHFEDDLNYVLCKPKLLPLKSFTMEKLEKLRLESIEKAKEELEAETID